MCDNRIAICDFRFHKGHRTFNDAVRQAVAKITDGNFVYFDNGNGYRSEQYPSQRHGIVNRYKEGSSPLKNRLISRAYMKEEYRELKKIGDSKKIICVAFDLITFGLCGKKYFKDNVYLWHHAESDELLSRIKRSIFRRYMNKVKHIVHTPFIKQFLVDFGVEESRIFVCPFVRTSDYYEQYVQEEKIFIAPSGSNDESFCKKLVEYEKRTRFFINNDIKFVIKSFDTEYDDGFLKLYNKYLSFDEYENLYKLAAAVVMPFPKSFQMRESGTVIDALSSGKGVIGSNIPIVEYYKKKCEDVGDDSAVKTFNDIEEFCNILFEYRVCNLYNSAQLIAREHSCEAIECALREVIYE